MNQKTSEILNQRLRQYYTAYYHKELNLADYQTRVQHRLDETAADSYYSSRNKIKLIRRLINFKFAAPKKVLVVGAGTGEEMAQLARTGCRTYGLEPNAEALEILKLRAALGQIDGRGLVQAVAEKIPFPDESFDLVYCWQVLEHVADVTKSIAEMVRVTKKNGWIFIGCPDYRQIVEPHYKVYLPLFLPKFISKLILLFRGRKTDFFDTLQFVTAKKIKLILKQHHVLSMQLIRSNQRHGLTEWIKDNLEIEPNQYWLINKLR